MVFLQQGRGAKKKKPIQMYFVFVGIRYSFKSYMFPYSQPKQVTWPSPGERLRCFLYIGKQSNGREAVMIMMKEKTNMLSLKLLIERYMLIKVAIT